MIPCTTPYSSMTAAVCAGVFLNRSSVLKIVAPS
jgi:hypothetical protein